MGALVERIRELLAIGTWYESAPWAIDGLIYFMLFVGLTKVTLGRHFEGRGGTAVVVAMGSALAIGTATFAYRSRFSLASLGGVGWLLLFIILGLLIFNLFRSMNMPLIPAVSVSTLIIGITAMAIGDELHNTLVEYGFDDLLAIMTIASLVALGWWIASHLSPRWASRQPRHAGHARDPRPIHNMDRDSRTIESVDASIIEMLEQLSRRIRRHGLDHHSGRLLRELKRRDRIVGSLYRRVLRALAAARWRASDDRMRLVPAVRDLLIAAKDNLSAFERDLEFAIEAHEAGNARLVLASIERLLQIEQRALQLARQLRSILERLRTGERQSIRVGQRRGRATASR